ncbi:hypothetical protein QEZ54_33400 [Catellatospora sp. KI3]|uniref:hypothetical protein n=1 Tax=Catellatospora sp. KI3 TaxID=3041620 RepID=UPI002482697D|nr:hypothetical protein [Catellatospora sp. KI3]MDI1465881.1 hypothetical protein [Catellatospora sp. KI3]
MTDKKRSVPVPIVSAVVKGEFVGPVQTVFSAQPKVQAVCTNWNSFDVPRMWDSVRTEDDPIAWGQVQGWESLGQLLADQHDRLARMRNNLVSVWQPEHSEAADKFFGFLDRLILAMRENAYAAAGTARGLDGVLAALRTAKDKVAPLKEQWDNVTSDWLPEWWDHAAENLNNAARQAMTDAEVAVGDHRRRFIVPSVFDYRGEIFGDITAATDADDTGGPHCGDVPSPRDVGAPNGPPPTPGYDPVLPGGPDLASLPPAVPAVPGSPVSLLPVPPGSPYAPNGGAYVLPGPGVGRGGWIAPMSASGSAAAAVGQGKGANTAGLMPVATPGSATGSPSGRGGAREGRRDVIWRVEQGVAPIIEGLPPARGVVTREQLAQQDEEFVDWFAGVATPWADDLKVKIMRRMDPQA